MTDYDPNYRPDPEPVDPEQERRVGAFLKITALTFVLGVSLIIWRCGLVAQFTFERQCKDVAGIEVKNKSLWRQYLIERRQDLVRTGNDTYRFPLTLTDHFTFTTDFVLGRTPETLKDQPFRNDAYVSLSSTGELVARFRNLRLKYDTIDGTMIRDCTGDYPSLYTDARPHQGP